ncbi:MAG: VOC family protein [Rhodobacter sp.]|nr:VOC family protein [Rhodobacter sp.]
MSKTHGMVWWTELMTGDVDAAVAYYSETCGWQFEPMPMPDGSTYQVGYRDGLPIVGISPTDTAEGAKPHWFSYFAVDDVDAAVAATKRAGGSVIQEPFDMPGTGRIAQVTDPTGAAVGLMTPEEQPG